MAALLETMGRGLAPVPGAGVRAAGGGRVAARGASPISSGTSCAISLSSRSCKVPRGRQFAKRSQLQVSAVQTPRARKSNMTPSDSGLLAMSGDGTGIINGADAWGASIGQVAGGVSSSSRRLRVAVDVDEVLARFLLSLNRYCKEAYGMEFDVDDYDVYNFASVWGCSGEESNHKVHAFFQSHHFSHGIPPIPGALEVLKRIKEDHDLVIVTSRQHVIQKPTLDWIEEHFPDIFEEVHFGNHFALEGKSKSKSEICKEVGAEVLIDDNPGYAKECAVAGIHVLLFDWDLGYPWSKTEDGPAHRNIKRVGQWEEVEESLAALSSYLGVAETL